MGLFADLIHILTSSVGWLFVVLVLVYWAYWPFWETKIQEWFNTFNTQIETVLEQQVAITQVVRALARVNTDISTQRVDEYLVKNGVDPDDFIETDYEDVPVAMVVDSDDRYDDDNRGYD